MCRFVSALLFSAAMVVLVAVAIPWLWPDSERLLCLNTATTAYCAEFERIEAALQHEVLAEMSKGELVQSLPWFRDGVPQLSEVEKHVKVAAAQGKQEYQFKLKGIPHIDPHCQPRPMHYYRTVDGVCNWPNLSQHTLGSVGQLYGRDREPSYVDGIDQPRKPARATPRALSNAFWNASQEHVREWEHTPYLVAFVEFLVHDILAADYSKAPEDTYDLEIPEDDTFFNASTDRLTFTRVSAAPGTGRGTGKARQNINQRSVWLDLSQVYGRSLDVQKQLRSGVDGKMKMGKGGSLLPTTEDIPGVRMEQRKREPVFVAGDPRANQDVLLLVLHHIYVLEHNRLCDELRRHYPEGLSEGLWNDERLFLTARTILSGKNNMVASAYFGAYFTDYLEKGGDPLVIFRSYMGKGPIQVNPFKVYPWKDVLNPVNNAPFALPVDFSVGYRWHDLLPGTILIRDLANQTIGMADVAQSSFSTKTFDKYGLASMVAGLAVTDIPHFHSGVSDQLRNVRWNFAHPKLNTGFDLVAWAIEAERERGVQTFNSYFGKDKNGKPLYEGHVPIHARKTFEEFTSDPRKLRLLKELYDSPDDVDLTVGQELDESNWPGTSIPTSVLAISFYTLSRGTYNDRFSMNWIMASCIVENQPWNCRPTNVLQEVFWKPIKGFNSDHVRWIDPYWLEEFDLKEAGANMLWRLLVRNSEAKCLQKNVFFKASDKNPIVCYDITFFPGPKKLSLDWLHWHSYGSLQPYWHDARKYGSAVYYKKHGQSVLLLSAPEFVDPVFNTQAFLGRPKNKLLRFSHTHVAARGTLGIADRELGAVWTALRKTVAGFAGTITPAMAARISDAAGVLAQQFVAASSRGGPFDPFGLVQDFTVDLYGEFAFGSQYQRKALREPLLYWASHARDFFNGLGGPAMEHQLKQIGKFLDAFRPTEDSVWYSVLLRERSELSQDVLKATMFDALAYSLNNAFTVNYGLFLLGVRPSLQAQLFEEIQSVAPGRPISVADLHRMPLLMKVVKEVNRAYPGGGGILSRQSFDATQIDGKIVPAGTVAIVNSLLLHHDPRFYEKPNDFNPLRWADSSLEALLDDTNRLSFLTYGAGQKACPANRLAMMQQALTLAKIVETVKFTYTPTAPPKVELGFGARPSTPVKIVAFAR